MKPAVLAFVGYYLPGYKSGGPVRSIGNMVEHLGEELDFLVVTRDRDLLDKTAYPDVAVDAWNPVGKARVYYASPGSLSLAGIARLIRETPHAVLYLNSAFDITFTALPLLARRLGWLGQGPDQEAGPSSGHGSGHGSGQPVVLAPRGEFSGGALAMKAWKKRPYLAMARRLGLYDDLTWQAASRHEAQDIRRTMGHTVRRLHVAPGLAPPAFDQSGPGRVRADGQPLRVVFLSRIAAKKNLDFALEVLQRVNVPVMFNVYGPMEDAGYWRHCQALAALLPANVSMHYRGGVPHHQVGRVFAEHDLFFFPSRGESYGHVIAESLAVGTPVLTANTTPWRGLEADGMGWDLPLTDMAGFAGRIEACAAMPPGSFGAWRSRIRCRARARLISPSRVQASRTLFIVQRPG